MNPGRELDALVGENVMKVITMRLAIATSDDGETAAAIQDPFNGPFFTEDDIKNWITESGNKYKLSHWRRYNNYSTSIADAWEVVEKLELFSWMGPNTGRGVIDSLYLRKDKFEWVMIDSDGGTTFIKGAQSAPHAICLAALKLVGVNV